MIKEGYYITAAGQPKSCTWDNEDGCWYTLDGWQVPSFVTVHERVS